MCFAGLGFFFLLRPVSLCVKCRVFCCGGVLLLQSIFPGEVKKAKTGTSTPGNILIGTAISVETVDVYTNISDFRQSLLVSRTYCFA